MKNIVWILFAALSLAACNFNDSLDFSGDLSVGEIVEGSLVLETPDTFHFEFPAKTFLFGVCEQLSVDVQVSLLDSAGNSLGQFDGPAQGPEIFSFEIDEAGPYRLVVAPFEDKTGDYALELKVVEALGTTLDKRADQLFYAYDGEGVPGGVVGVYEHGELVFSRAYGMANLSHGIPYRVNTPTNIGSVSKQFTAMAVLLLEKEGKLSLDDDVRTHIPELPDLGQVVTLKNMLNHTNGFREVYNLMPMTGWKGEDMLRREEVIELLKRQEELQAAPGEEYNYNNSAFILLAEIVERISGKSFPEFMEERVFEPLGMDASWVRSNPGIIIPGASQGYVRDSLGYREAGDLYAAYGAGGIYTTLDDFGKWLGNFSKPLVGGLEVVKRLVTVDTLNNGDTMTYALGIGVGEFRGLKTYSHGGADIAHRAFLLYFPEIDGGVVAMSNNAAFGASDIAYNMAEVYFGDQMEAEATSQKQDADNAETADETEMEVPRELLEAYVGNYLLEGMGIELEFKVWENTLKIMAEGQPDATLIPLSRSAFRIEDSEVTITFLNTESGEVKSAVLDQNGMKFNLERLAPYSPTLEELQALTGKFFSKELETFYTLELRDTTLTLFIRNTEPVELSAIKKDSYKGNVFFIGELVFQRDKRGQLSGFTASNGRTKGIRFEKME